MYSYEALLIMVLTLPISMHTLEFRQMLSGFTPKMKQKIAQKWEKSGKEKKKPKTHISKQKQAKNTQAGGRG